MKMCPNCANCGAPPLARHKCLYCDSLFQDELINSIQNDQFDHQSGYTTYTTCVDLGYEYVRQLG